MSWFGPPTAPNYVSVKISEALCATPLGPGHAAGPKCVWFACTEVKCDNIPGCGLTAGQMCVRVAVSCDNVLGLGLAASPKCVRVAFT